MDVAKMIARKDNVVKQNNDGILYLFKKNKVSFFHGRGSFAKAVEGGYEVTVAGDKPETAGGQAGHRRHRLQRPRAARVHRLTKKTSCPTTARCASARCPRSWA
jgi:pyruvate/2-oxoglutarate dehydrogenase complex dihydrolipoamide dehydrogenase (E3) component